MFIFDSLHILRKTPQLVICNVSGFWQPWLGFYGQQNIGAPVVTSLRSLQLLNLTSADDYLNNIIAPRLEELRLPKFYNPSTEVITSFFRRSACSLRSFSMDFRRFSPDLERFMIFFQSMNTVSIISITETASVGLSYPENITPDYYDLQNIFQLVAKVLFSQSTFPQQGFLPNLKILEYTGVGGKMCLPAGNLDALYPLPPADSSVHGPLHLFKLDLRPVTRIPKNMISYLSRIVERGVTVNVLSKSEDILQSSIDYYRSREESLCRDWADNLDSSLFS